MTVLSLVEVIDLIKGVLQFPNAVFEFVKLLRKTPEEKHSDLIASMQAEERKLEDTGRPTW